MYEKLIEIAKASSPSKLEIINNDERLDICPDGYGFRYCIYGNKLWYKGFLKGAFIHDEEMDEYTGIIGFWIVDNKRI